MAATSFSFINGSPNRDHKAGKRRGDGVSSYHNPDNRTPRAGSLRTDKPAFAGVHATTNSLWREYYTRHHEAKRETNQSKEKAVFEMLIGISYWLFVDVSFVD
jgi:hypothetical protein